MLRERIGVGRPAAPKILLICRFSIFVQFFALKEEIMAYRQKLSLKALVYGGMMLAFVFFSIQPSRADTYGYADVVLDYFDSGVGDMPGPYGGTWNGSTGSYPQSVSTSVVLGDDPGYPGAFADFLSLPKGTFVTVGFTDETVIDGLGDDIFLTEVGANGEMADVWVSANGSTFTYLGIAVDDGVTGLDLNSIGFTLPVTAIKIMGLDTLGGSAGFDLINVRVLPGSLGPPVPEPSTLLLLFSGLGALGALAYRRSRK
jgi:hypothetical protein